jgi:diguanylate cyclase (GGDEF)-like protein/hemerythrin-like metal-binding protein
MSAVDDAACSVQDARFDPGSLGALVLHSTVLALAVIRRGRIEFANPAFLAMFRPAEGLTGIPLADIVVDTDCHRLAEALADAEHASVRYFGSGCRGADRSFDVELCLETATLAGEPAIIAFAWDVTDQHRSDERLAYLAYTDPLTGLANRALFADRLHQAGVFARRHGVGFAVLMVDLDGFKSVNDAHGHEAGDVVLQLVGQRFQGCIRDGDTLSRIGGDEFAVLLPRSRSQRTATLVAQRLLAALAPPLSVGEHAVVVGASIGIAAWPEHAGSVDALLAAADTAMYRAKRSGKNQFQWAAERSSGDVPSLPPLTWSAAHAVGVQEIDDQHVRLAEKIDRLSGALKDALDPDAVLADLNDLIRYAAFHFATEERLMEQHRIADLVRHREEHRRLLHDIGNLRVDGELASLSLILRYLQEWLLRHIDGMDRRLGQALVALGCH